MVCGHGAGLANRLGTHSRRVRALPAATRRPAPIGVDGQVGATVVPQNQTGFRCHSGQAAAEREAVTGGRRAAVVSSAPLGKGQSHRHHSKVSGVLDLYL